MEITFQISKVLSIALFLYYGGACLLTDRMVAEFERFGLARFRRLTGSLEVLGAFGILCGYLVPILVIPASGGLSLLMLLGLGARVRVKDTVAQMLAAVILLIVNLYILGYALASLPGV